MGISKFRFEPFPDSINRGKCYLDDQFIPSVRSFTCLMSPDEIPTVHLEINATSTMELLADTSVTMPIENAADALRCLRVYCQLREPLRDRLEWSIREVLNRNDVSDLASKILDSILNTEVTD